MMSIEERIKSIVDENFSEFSYVFEDWYDADRAIGKMKLPAIICILPVSGSLEEHPNSGRMKDTENTAIAFVDKVKRDAKGYDNYETYNRMKKAAKKFIRTINKDDYFRPLQGKQNYSVIYEQTATIVTGVYLDLALEQEIGVCEDD